MSRSIRFVVVALVLNAAMHTFSFAQNHTQQLPGPHGGICFSFAMTDAGAVLASGPVVGFHPGGKQKLILLPLSKPDWVPWQGIEDSVDLYCIEPISPAFIFAGTSEGLYLARQYPYGHVWEAIGFGGVRVTAITRLENDSIYLGTSDGDIHVSDDYGMTWSFHSHLPDRMPISFMMDDRHRLYVHHLFAFDYRFDNGQWEQMPNALGQEELVALGQDVFLNVHQNGINRSTDDGNTWELRLPRERGNWGGPKSSSLVKAPGGTVYAGMTSLAEDSIYGGVYKSVDGGINWTKLHKGPITKVRLGPHGELLAASFAAGILRIDTTTGAAEYLGGPAAFVRQIAMNYRSQTAGHHLFATLDSIYSFTPGVVHSADEGRTWEWIPLSYRKITHVTTDGFASVAAWNADAQRLHISRDNGSTWKKCEMPSRSLAIVLHTGGAVYAAGYASTGLVHISQNDGDSWTSVPVDPGHEIFGLAGTRTALLAATSSGVYRSMDQGTSWQQVLAFQKPDVVVTGMAASEDFPPTYTPELVRLTYDAPSGSGMLVSMDNGNQWQEIIVDPNSGALYNPGISSMYTVLSSSDFDLLDGPADSLKLLYSGDGQHWVSLGEEYRPSCLTAVPAYTWYFGTHGNGVFKTQLYTGISDRFAVHPDMELGQNFPNPFNPSTVIPFTLEKRMTVSLVITDLLGREVARPLHCEPNEAGTYAIRFDAGGMPSGQYFYRLEAGDAVLHRAMLLLR
ncbi:MAG: hypothetical protein IH600_03835 [Bacteroidetes bacterium]|nr:hypothetical protein [Bacteroidota bacterium]